MINWAHNGSRWFDSGHVFFSNVIYTISYSSVCGNLHLWIMLLCYYIRVVLGMTNQKYPKPQSTNRLELIYLASVTIFCVASNFITEIYVVSIPGQEKYYKNQPVNSSSTHSSLWVIRSNTWVYPSPHWFPILKLKVRKDLDMRLGSH